LRKIILQIDFNTLKYKWFIFKWFPYMGQVISKWPWE